MEQKRLRGKCGLHVQADTTIHAVRASRSNQSCLAQQPVKWQGSSTQDLRRFSEEFVVDHRHDAFAALHTKVVTQRLHSIPCAQLRDCHCMAARQDAEMHWLQRPQQGGQLAQRRRRHGRKPTPSTCTRNGCGHKELGEATLPNQKERPSARRHESRPSPGSQVGAHCYTAQGS